MGSSSLGGKSGSSSGSDQSGIATALQGLASQDIGLSGAQENIAGEEVGYGNNILGPAYSQYAAGATGQLTPAQQALVTQALGNMNLGTMANYSNLGLGGSTMEQQDLNANQLSSLAQQSGLEAESEQMGLSALQEGLGFLGAGSGALGASGSALNNAGSLLGGATSIYNTQDANNASALSSLASGLGGKSGSSGTGTSGAGSSSASGILGLLGNYFGSSDSANLAENTAATNAAGGLSNELGAFSALTGYGC